MAREEMTGKPLDELIDRAWEIAEETHVATLITIEGDQAIARPMSPRVERESGAVHFLSSVDSRKVQHSESPDAQATVFCEHGNGYVSFVGSISTSNDRAKIKELWSAADKAWWDSADDASIRLVTVRPTQAELWDGPNKLAAAALMLTAAITGAKPKMGDHATVPTR